jgi:glycosyltransferase involved in cell wall biosynthesis
LFPSKHEGFGLPIIEAMVEGRVCITSDIPVFREIVEPGIDLIADTLNPSSWAEKILEMSEKPQSSRRRTLKSTKWNWQTTGKLIETEITSVWNSYIKQKTMSHAF